MRISGWSADGCSSDLQEIVEDSADAADAEAEDEALDVEPSRLCQVEQAGRIPIFRNEKRLGETEWGGEQAYQQHRIAMLRECCKCGQPRRQERARPDQPTILFGNHPHLLTCKPGKETPEVE